MEFPINPIPVVYDVGNKVHVNGWILPPDHYEPGCRVTIERRISPEKERWAICSTGGVLSKSEGEFVYESIPSERTAEELADNRFDSFEEALAFYKEWRPKAVQACLDRGWKVWEPKQP